MVTAMTEYDPYHDGEHGESDNRERSIITLIPSLSCHIYLVYRVRMAALKLASDPSISSRSPDLLVIDLAALLHDVLDKKQALGSIADDPYAFFLPMFTELDGRYPSVKLLAEGGKRVKLIADIVKNVSWTTEKKLRQEGKWGKWHDTCVEFHCVQDADRLDAMGALGMYTIRNWRGR